MQACNTLPKDEPKDTPSPPPPPPPPQGLIFVVDSNDKERAAEAKDELNKMVSIYPGLPLWAPFEGSKGAYLRKYAYKCATAVRPEII